jgi:hypothetical protein
MIKAGKIPRGTPYRWVSHGIILHENVFQNPHFVVSGASSKWAWARAIIDCSGERLMVC